MTNVIPIPSWAAREAAYAFALAMGTRRRAVVERIAEGAHCLTVDVVPSVDIDTMRQRAVRAGRMLADEAMRKRLRSFTALPPSKVGDVTVTSLEQRVAMRLSVVYLPALDGPIYRFDMLGSRLSGTESRA